MFCCICQKSFKTKKNFDFHSKSKLHKIEYQKYNSDPLKFKKRLGDIFINHFSLFIADINLFTEIGVVYKNYLNSNKYRIKGTNYKNLTEAVNDLTEKIDIEMRNGVIYVKKLTCKINKQEIDLSEIKFYFKCEQ